MDRTTEKTYIFDILMFTVTVSFRNLIKLQLSLKKQLNLPSETFENLLLLFLNIIISFYTKTFYCSTLKS